MPDCEERAEVRLDSAQGRWLLAATALGSGMAFLDGSIVNVALPRIGKDFGSSIAGLQWTINSYMVTLTALLLLGGSLGDRYGRRLVFAYGLSGFSLASILCAVSPNLAFLIGARTVQGVAAALLVPGSLAIIAATFHDADRGRAIGIWSGLAGISTSIAPFLGGWLIDAVSWRLIFLINVPIGLAAFHATRKFPETAMAERNPIDYQGAGYITVALAGISYAFIQHKGAGSLVLGVVGLSALLGFLVREHRAAHPMLPLRVFRSRQFSGCNAMTFAVYGALSGAIFLLVLRLQESLHYSALAAGSAFAPFSIVMLTLSPRMGALGQRLGPRLPMTVGPLVAAVGVALLSRVGPGDHYLSAVFPGVMVFALGMSITVAPLTTAVLASVNDAMAGVASGVNNAISRLGGLISIAILPAVSGIATSGSVASSLSDGYGRAVMICAIVAAVGGAISFLTVRPYVKG